VLRGDETSVDNLYLIAGIRGAFHSRLPRIPTSVPFALLHTLDRWGVPAPWGPCDGGADLETPDDLAIRGWCHVDLRVSRRDEFPDDVPVLALLRTIWDTLELYGTTTLTGVDVALPLECAGAGMSSRYLSKRVSAGLDRQAQIGNPT
jgi:hypothetical protein